MKLEHWQFTAIIERIFLVVSSKFNLVTVALLCDLKASNSTHHNSVRPTYLHRNRRLRRTAKS